MASGRRGANVVRTSSPVLVGRGAELRALLDTVPSRSTMVLIEGEAGVGKTLLVHELLVHELLVQPRIGRLRVMVGHCRQVREPFPYGALIEALRAPAGLPAVELSPVVGALRPLLPELGHLLPPEPVPIGDPHAERHRLLRAVREFLGALGPVLLVVEDLQWADDGTRQMLRFVMSDPPPGLSVVVTYRREDLAGRPPLGAACRPPDTVARVVLRLAPLDVGGVAELAGAILADEVPADLAARLHERTAGIPFVVEELLRSWSTTAALEGPADGSAETERRLTDRLFDDVEVPVLLRDAIADRLAGLPAPTRRLIHAAAVLGVPSRVEQLMAVASIDADTAWLALTQAAERGVLFEIEPARYGFRHSLARQAVYDALSGPVRQDLHAAAIGALARLDPPPLVQLAEHSRSAGRTADWLNYGERAADLATAVGDPSAATALLRRLVAEPDLRGPDVDRLAVKLGTVAYSGLDPHDPVATLERLLNDRRLSTAARGEVRLFLGLLLVRQEGRVEAARAEIRRAVADLSEQRPGLAAKGIALLGTPFIGGAPFAEQRVLLAEAERRLARCDDGELRISLLANLLGSRLHVGDPAVQADLLSLPYAADDVGERRQLARARCNLADACTTVGHFAQAREFLATGTQLAASAGSPFVISTARSTQVRLDWYTGDWSGLADRAHRLLADYRDLLPVASELSLVLGLLAIARGEWGAAEEHLVRTGTEAPNEAITPVVIAGFAGLARMRLARDDAAGAAGAAEEGIAVLRRKGVWTWAADLAPVSVGALLAAGGTDPARAFVAELATEVADRDAPLVHAALLVCRGELAETDGDLSAAAGCYAAAHAAYERLPAPYLAALAAERGTLCRLALGDVGVGDELAVLADAFEQLGAARDAARCRHDVRSHGGTTPSRRGRRGYGGALSPREQDVARLASRGLTNREIADVLFLSPRTFEQHVAKVLRKLGVRSRSDISVAP
ncbi:AAA family ATPase [Streptomyces sp. WMMC500]|uniref:ATP-binding protein n=1 Tax=Streptomyces sp. WMMC500 TaxID=3015154 RepID=UPI00248B5133|nr:LuxR family transcriptional regulator [Streptomyces sp. WMMC500]WBB61231.1 AAA family ATPase [Streptomyces sp. WMMC500]